FAARVVLALVAVCVVLATAIIVVIGTGDEQTTKLAATNAIGVAPAADPAPPPVSTEVAPPPAVDPPPAAPAVASDAPVKKKRLVPRSIKNAKPPPNPYDGATAKR
ncbi:MAG TPA: hypothetical protein VIF62_10795, partial [Labilithrix sp.]